MYVRLLRQDPSYTHIRTCLPTYLMYIIHCFGF